MATMSGITGTLSGKMGSAVFRVRAGQQVVAQYQPSVANPNTEAQQTARAKFKLITQLAAIMGPGFGTMLVTKRNPRGKGSARNGFVQIAVFSVGKNGQTARPQRFIDRIRDILLDIGVTALFYDFSFRITFVSQIAERTDFYLSVKGVVVRPSGKSRKQARQ